MCMCVCVYVRVHINGESKNAAMYSFAQIPMRLCWFQYFIAAHGERQADVKLPTATALKCLASSPANISHIKKKKTNRSLNLTAKSIPSQPQ